MKTVSTFLFFFLTISIFAQGKYLTKSGTIDFEASVPSFEEVKAKNSSVTAVLNTANGEFASLALMKGFRFKVALMEEHFNENYIESDDYPNATIKGKIDGFDMSTLEGTKEYTFKGTLSLHGKSKEISTPVTLTKEGNTIKMTTKFSVTPEEFDINIPGVVRKKVAEGVDVTVDFDLASSGK
jgi:hypothetical protein